MNRLLKISLAVCSISICACLLLGVTYSWFTTRESLDNKFNTANLSTSIYEIYAPQKAWKPDVPVQKEVGIVNNGTGAAIVRVSLNEYLLMLETGTHGDPTVQTLGSMRVADLTNPGILNLAGGLAVPASKYTESGPVPMENGNGPLYYKVEEILKSLNFSPAAGRNPLIEKYVEIGWGAVLGTDWYFNPDDSCFYYLKPLPSGGSTPRLLETVRLSGDYPNLFQFAPYFIEVNHDSILASRQTLTEQWGFSESSYIYQALAPLLD